MPLFNKKSSEIHAKLVIDKGDQAISLCTINNWIAAFRADNENVGDKPHSGYFCKPTTPEVIAKVKNWSLITLILLLEDC
ncbi:hypothetical protein F8M41_011478 [Gigaspora margarita]|uniref:Transposase n=1 Tax=Gigaspora margarita TaxID=4874 RepID=A0A8H4EQ39_GIGMA|nr:hypothetical protein F8M41_011478 [Gigaspora margarita]